MIPVSSLDASMLYVETVEMPMHTMGVLLIERPSDAETSAMQLIRDSLEERLHLIPPFRRKLVQGPLKIGDPYWIEDPEFDLGRHLSHHVLPAPGRRHELDALIGELAGGCLARDKPLWEMALIEGLEDGKIALVTKVHHATMDGGKGASLMGQLFSTEPHGAVSPPEERWVPEPEPRTPWLMADTVRTLVGKPRRVATAASGIISGLRGGGKKSGGSAQEDKLAKPGLFEAPSTMFNAALTPNRVVGLCDVPLDDVKSIGRALDATVNDVVLAASCASLRAWLLSHGGLPDRPLVGVVPVSLRSETDEGEANRVAVMRVRLPLDVEDPVERLRAIHEAMRTGKKGQSRGAGGGGVLKHMADIATNVTVPLFLTQLLGLYSSGGVADRIPPLWNLVISNIAGSPVPLYFGEARLRQLYPLGPVQQGSGLNITVLSTDGRLCFGALACKELVPDVEDIATGFEEEIGRLMGMI
jgi:WS/DGAT/MGAT family acyltransferase